MPVFKGDDLVLCDVAGVSAFDVGQLVYFGMSIFWRAAVHKWATTTGLIAPKVDLGALEGPTRKFRRCEGPVPEDGIVLTVDVWPYKRAIKFCTLRSRRTCRNASGIGSTYLVCSSRCIWVAIFRLMCVGGMPLRA